MSSNDFALGDDVTGAGFTKFEHATVGVLYLLFCVVGVTTNFLTAFTFYKDAKLFSSSQPWIHIILAMANIGVVAPSPFPASSSFSGRWLYGTTLCQFYAFEGMFVGLVAIGAVIALCLERYFVLNRSKSNARTGTGWFYGWSTVLILGNGFFWAVMPLLGWSRYEIEHTGTSCAIAWKNPDESYISYIVTLTVFSFGLPLVVALFCLHSAHPKSCDQPTPGAGPSNQTQGSDSPQAAEPNVGAITEDQLHTMCYVFILMVLVGWGPFAFLCLATIQGGSAGLSMLAACIPPLTCKFMVSMYPLVYAVVSPRFRHSFMSLLGDTHRKQD